MGGRGAYKQLQLGYEFGIAGQATVAPDVMVGVVQAAGFKNVAQAYASVQRVYHSKPLPHALRQAVNQLPGPVRGELLERSPQVQRYLRLSKQKPTGIQAPRGTQGFVAKTRTETEETAQWELTAANKQAKGLRKSTKKKAYRYLGTKTRHRVVPKELEEGEEKIKYLKMSQKDFEKVEARIAHAETKRKRTRWRQKGSPVDREERPEQKSARLLTRREQQKRREAELEAERVRKADERRIKRAEKGLKNKKFKSFTEFKRATRQIREKVTARPPQGKTIRRRVYLADGTVREEILRWNDPLFGGRTKPSSSERRTKKRRKPKRRRKS